MKVDWGKKAARMHEVVEDLINDLTKLRAKHLSELEALIKKSEKDKIERLRKSLGI